MTRLLLSAVLAAGTVAGVVWALRGDATSAEPERATAPLRVLFVGNSLTATNDLPGEVEALARRDGRELETGSVVFGGFSLEDHWNRGDARREIGSANWDVIAMQQGPSAEPASQVHLRRWTQRFATVSRAAGSRTGLLTVWPESYRLRRLGDVIASYRKAASAAQVELFPAGAAWQLAWSCDRRLELYGADGFHPSRLGTHLAALVVYGRLSRRALLTPALQLDGVPQKTARMLQAAAALSLGRKIAPGRRCG